MLGNIVSVNLIMVAGVVAFAVLIFQFLQGKRIIKFKGVQHRKIHATTGLILVVLAAVHGLLGFAWWLSLR